MTAPAPESDKSAGAATGPARRETFLVRYPRNVKIGALAIVVVVILSPWVFFGSSGTHPKAGSKLESNVNGADSKAAITNAMPLPDTTANSKAADNVAKNVIATATDNSAGGEDSSSAFMVPAPDPGLIEDTPQGSLPRIGEDGRQAWHVYARPFNTSDKRPRISIIITDLGLARVSSDAAIDRLPPNVTLAFDAQSPVVGAWCARARQSGHETLLVLPMEPFDYPRSDPGPNTLLTNIPNSDNLQRLRTELSEATGYVGITTLTGSRFTTDPDHIKPVLAELHSRGLMVFDTRIAPHSAITDLAHDAQVPVAANTQRLDQNLSPDAIDENLSQLEQTARLTGKAIGMTPPLPIMLDHLVPWIKQLQRDGIALAPLSAMVQ